MKIGITVRLIIMICQCEVIIIIVVFLSHIMLDNKLYSRRSKQPEA